MQQNPKRSPDLDAQVTVALASRAADLTVNAMPEYGQPLNEAIDAGGPFGWLEAAVLAGYLPSFEGIELALEATQAWYLELIAKAEREAVLGDALTLAGVVEAYRSLVAAVEQYVAEIEERAADIHRRPQANASDELIRMWEEDAQAALARAARSRSRGESALADNRQFQVSRDRYGDLQSIDHRGHAEREQQEAA